jgi:transposase
MKKVRTREPKRDQGWLFKQVPGAQVAETDPVRVLSRVIAKLDLSAFVEDAKAVEGAAGRPVTSPRLLLTLWVCGIREGIGSARELARRCTRDEPYRWLVGDMEVSHDTLSAFLTQHRRALEGTFTQVLGLLMSQGLLDLSVMAQDGFRVRASASAPSFRRAKSLGECREQALLHLKAVLAAAEAEEGSPAMHAARKAAAEDYLRRVDAAIETLKERQAHDDAKPPSQKSKQELRASTTDADARVMKMADGGFRPGFNFQFGVAGDPEGGPRTIVAVGVTNEGTDAASVIPMVKQVERRTGAIPSTLLADGQHVTVDDIKECIARGIRPLLPVPDKMAKPSKEGDKSPELQSWKQLMASGEAQAEYRGRAALVENVNAQVRSRYDVKQVLVRGLGKVTCWALMVSLAHNLDAHAAKLLAHLA